MMIKYYGVGGLMAVAFLGNVLFSAGEPQVIIDTTNKKILIQSGAQTLGLEDFKAAANTIGGAVIGVKTQSGTVVQAASGTVLENTGTMSPVVTGTNTTAEISSGTVLKSTVDAELASGTELEKAIYWMYANGLTKYDVVSEYRPKDPLLREEAAKIITNAYLALGYPTTIKHEECNFKDAEIFDPTLAESIKLSCSYGIFKGNEGTFHAKRSLTKAEALTVLVRIFEAANSNEKLTPRWTMYFIKAKAIGLTNETDVNAMDRPVTREEIALLIYRFKNIVRDAQQKATATTQLSNINQNPTSFLQTYLTGTLATGEQNANVNEQILNLLSGGKETSTSLSVLNNPEITEAMHRMREYGLTSATDISTYHAFDVLTREQTAKMLVQFAKIENFHALSGAQASCTFKDINEADPSLKESIIQVCQLGLMQGANETFSPKKTISKAEFIALLIRLSNGARLDESTTPRWSNYFLKARDLGLISNDDILSFETQMTRYEAALVFYRFWVKQKILTTLNTSQLKNELITTVKNTDGSFIELGTGVYAVSVDTNLLKNQFFQEGFIEILGQRYALKKTNITTFDIGNESFVWYGDLFEISSENKIGNLNFIVSNGNIVDASVRFLQEAKNWKLKVDPSTTAWFQLTR